MRVRGTYTNPLIPTASPDPFVLKHRDRYWCYCTGWASADLVFPVFESVDLIHWQPAGGAMPPIEGGHSQYWAPEVVYWEGSFFLYYSVGDGTVMHLRVAVANVPQGPFSDSGHQLTAQEFAIDSHVFEDSDGRRWLFYATDFLQHTHVGTGTVRDLLKDPFTLAGNPLPVVRAQYDWHLFDAQRAEKGGVRWHTIEGPTVLKHKGLYYEMFSGGNWKNTSYGVGYAVTDNIEKSEEWRQVCDGNEVLPVLRTVPGHVSGPGHNSVVRGPDNVQWYCVYHRWNADASERVLSIDLLEWIGRNLVVFGPTYTPQFLPNLPATRFPKMGGENKGGEPDWEILSGSWTTNSDSTVQADGERFSEIRTSLRPHAGFVLECGVRLGHSSGLAGFRIHDAAGHGFNVLLGGVLASSEVEGKLAAKTQTPDVFHALRVESSGRLLRAFLDGVPLGAVVAFPSNPHALSLVSYERGAQFSGLALTRGWQDLFTTDERDLSSLSWRVQSGSWHVDAMELHHSGGGTGSMFKPASAACEFVVNARLSRDGIAYGFFPASSESHTGPLIAVVSSGGKWVLGVDTNGTGDPALFEYMDVLPPRFDPYEHQQFRCRVQDGLVSGGWRNEIMFEIPVKNTGGWVGLWAWRGASFDMIRTVELAVQ
jgi:GH43 family beta-xylosidase